ncbi:MAG: LPS assembly protein LptD, partial [Proteobacteria bacterium]|nr:LPS assembly protein LptD [Pseudomonadota bacterium]
MMIARALWIVLGLIALAANGPDAIGQQVNSEQPVLMTADDLSFDEDLGTATARGNVEIVQGERILNADAVTYNQRDNIVTATGNVVLLEPSGEVLFAEFAELTSDMREGFLRGFRMLLNDDSRLAAASAQRRGGIKTELTRAVYSPCRDCLGFDEEPLWQIKARRVVHDSEAQEVVYRDATLEVAGIPIAYTPYLSHPDPTVERKTGILTPTFGVSSLLGSSIQVPYFWAISNESDLTFDPILSTDQLPVVTGEYRQRFASGENRTRLSFTNDDAQTDQNRFRGHIDSESRFSIDELWRWGADIRVASDDTYLGRYGFKSDDTLTNRLYVEGFGSRSYAVAEALYFQGLRDEDIQEQTPIAAPNLDYRYVSSPGSFGGMTTLDANMRALTREEGASSQRISLTPGWQISHTDGLGSITSFRTSVQGDLYNVDDVDTNSGREDAVVGRIFPQAIVSWRYPWVRRSGPNSQTFEPLMALVLAPNGGNPEKIPDEDSQSVAFDETNLFAANRFSGTDRVEGGQRFVYGIRTGVFGELGGASTLTVGQSIRFRKSNPFPSGTGLEDQFSDIVANLQITPNRFMNLLYKTRFDHDSLRARRTEIAASIGPPALKADIDYVFFDRTSGFADREEVTASLQSKLTEEW